MHGALCNALAASWLTAATLIAGPAAEEAEFQIEVDPRFELVGTIFRLAGNPEYAGDAAGSAYVTALDRHFARFREHEAVVLARELRASLGISHDAVASLAIHLDGMDPLRERVPFDAAPRLLERWTTDAARRFTAAAQRFAADSGFAAFLAGQAAYQRAAQDRLRSRLGDRRLLPWFDAFFGARPDAQFRLIPGLVAGPNNFGVTLRSAGGRETISPVIGIWRFDGDGLPVYGDEVVPLVVHELCHAYVNPVVDQHYSELAPAGEEIFPRVQAVMQAQAYGHWRIVLCESLVRASVVRHVAAHGDTPGTDWAANDDVARGFLWVPALAARLEPLERDPERPTTLTDLMPDVVAFFDDLAREWRERPRITAMEPAPGARGVDPGLTGIRIEFDRPMQAGMSVLGGGDSFPEVAGRPAWDAAGRVLTIPVRLQPRHEYRFSLNGPGKENFRSAEGKALIPVPVTFHTR